MPRYFDVIDHESEKRKKVQYVLLFFAFCISISILMIPEIKKYKHQWDTLRVARKLGSYILQIKTDYIKSGKAFEVRFTKPGLVEFYEVSSCGVSQTNRLIEKKNLSDFSGDIDFLSASEVSKFGIDDVTLLNRFCYNPLTGSSLSADGIFHGSIFLWAKNALEDDHFPVKITFVGTNGDVEIE